MYSALIPDPGPQPLPEAFLFSPNPHWFFVLMAGSAVVLTLAAGAVWFLAARHNDPGRAKDSAVCVLIGIFFVIAAVVAAIVTPIES